MQAFSNDTIKDNLCGGCDCQGFVPSVTFVYNSGAKTLVATDATTFPAGTARMAVHISVYDKHGNKALGTITAADGDDAITISLAELDASDGIDVLGTVVSDGGCLSDGHASNIAATGALGSWDKDNDSIAVGSASASS